MADKSSIYVIRNEGGKVVATSPSIAHGVLAFLRPVDGHTLHIVDVSHKLLNVSAKELHDTLAKEEMRHIENVEEHYMEVVRKVLGR